MDLEQRSGLVSRPLGPADAHAVFEVMAAEELADIGMVEIEEADIVGDWARPSFDVAASTLGMFDGDRLVGYAEVTGADRGDAAVHPAYRGRGIGTRLAHWMQETARRRGATVIGMPVPAGSPSDRLLAALGYHVRWTSWVLKLPVGASVVERELPPGYAVRAAEPPEHAAAHALVEDAFLEWSVRDREPFEDFAASVLGRPGFAPWNLRVMVDDTETVVGVAHVLIALTDDGRDPEAYIPRLAVRRDLRGRGLAQALMVDAFAAAREHGAVVCGLSTDSRTGALGLYEKVGMEVTSVWLNRAVTL
ncbi:MAG: GNAT family N-acetyltransferase [Nocardioides sp.]